MEQEISGRMTQEEYDAKERALVMEYAECYGNKGLSTEEIIFQVWLTLDSEPALDDVETSLEKTIEFFANYLEAFLND